MLRKAFIFLSIILLSLGTFAQNLEFIPPTTLSDLQEADGGSMDLGDIDQDGDLDLVIIGLTSNEGAKTSLYLNDGTGLFIPLENDQLVNTYNGTARFVDVDNDGALDLIVIASNSSPFSTASLYRNDGTGLLTLDTESGLRGSKSGDFDMGDVDADGDIDLIISGNEFYFDGGVIDELFTSLFLNDGTGNFTEEIDSPFEPVDESDLGFTDLDNDGDLDVIVIGKDANESRSTNVYLNDGSGVYSPMVNHPFEDMAGDLSISDCDNDGDEDVLLIGANNDAEILVQLFINDGIGNFSLEPGFDIPASLGITDFADLDNDGDQDILIFGLSGANIIGHIYENMGANNYMLADSMYGSYLSSLTVGDIDGDDDLDFLVSGSSFDPIYPTSRTVRVFFNNLDATTGLNESVFEGLSVHPNPTEDELRISTDEPIEEVLLYNIVGQLVLRKYSNSSIARLDLRGLKGGVYVLQLRNDKNFKSIRIIKK